MKHVFLYLCYNLILGKNKIIKNNNTHHGDFFPNISDKDDQSGSITRLINNMLYLTLLISHGDQRNIINLKSSYIS